MPAHLDAVDVTAETRKVVVAGPTHVFSAALSHAGDERYEAVAAAACGRRRRLRDTQSLLAAFRERELPVVYTTMAFAKTAGANSA